MPFQLVNTHSFLELSQFLCKEVRDTFQQAILKHAENFALQQDEGASDAQDLLQPDRLCTPHHCLFPE